ncbi:isocitrate lyase/phosphoenolpyruvate mutase family protein [Methylomonas sp. AM2-LC]|uniref:isocitrate lyase/PEP mutase family protein n=1 Tax=Methylomonas sp. AM2-LC TaxID=3153301 RepID=UPI003263DFC8
MKNQIEKSKEFVELHQSGNCFVMPNPWDIGSARLLAQLGFKAIASTGAGFAFSRGSSDLSINVRDMLPHLAELSMATDLPLSADLQNGFGDSADDVAQTILAVAKTGIVGGSIEDASGNADNPIYDIELAAERILSAAAAAKTLGFKFMLTARAENYLYGKPDIGDTIRRLQAYQEAGADVLFAPGIQSKHDIQAILQNIDKPLNVIMGFNGIQLSVSELQELGVTRISLGGSLARAAYGAFLRAATEVQSAGTFNYATEAVSAKELNGIFASY